MNALVAWGRVARYRNCQDDAGTNKSQISFSVFHFNVCFFSAQTHRCGVLTSLLRYGYLCAIFTLKHSSVNYPCVSRLHTFTHVLASPQLLMLQTKPPYLHVFVYFWWLVDTLAQRFCRIPSSDGLPAVHTRSLHGSLSFSRLLYRNYSPNVTHGRGSLPLVATCVSQCDWVGSANLVGG